MKPKEYSYYNVDVGFFPRCVKLCFNTQQFKDILRDQKLDDYTFDPLSLGVAETHYIYNEKTKKGVIIAIFNLDEMKDSIDEMVSTIVHEAVHVVERIGDYISEEEEFSEETRAYLTESIVRQIFKACVIEKGNYVRKTSGEILQTRSGKSGGIELQVDKHSDGGARQNRVPKRKSPSSRTKSKDRKIISKTNNRI